MQTFVVSDLARQRREVVDAARREPVRIRDTDGTMLVLTTEDREEAVARIIELYDLHARASIECRNERPNAAVLGPLHYLAGWAADRRTWFLDGLATALAEARRLNDPSPAAFAIAYYAPFDAPVPVAVDEQFVERFADAVRRHVDA